MDTPAQHTEAGGVFIRKSSGLTRQISSWDALMYCAMNPGLLFAMVYIMWTPWLYPGANMPLAVLAVIQMFPIAALYWFFSVAMSRSGGEYVYVSRVLHPALGIMSSFAISLVGISWFGVLTDWWLKWSLSDFFRGVGLIYADSGWLATADFFDQTWIRTIIGTVAIVITGYIFLKGARWMMRLSWITVAVAWLGIIVFGIAVAIGANSFAGNWTAMTGVDYATIIPIAQEAGYLVQFTFIGTLMGGSTYVVLNTLGQTFSANMAGEIRGVQKSQMIALFGSLVILMAIWFAFYQLSYIGFGGEWANSLFFLFNEGHEAYPLGSAEPFATLMVAFLTQSPIFVFLIAFSFFVATFMSAAGLAFGPTRNIFAWAFDRIIPPKFAEIDRRFRSPWLVILATVIAGWIFFMIDVYLPVWTANIGFTIMAWFAAWIILGIAGMLFPYIKKSLFEASPPLVKSRFLGVPVITWLGALTFLISLSIDIYMLLPVFEGNLPIEAIYVTLGFLIFPLLIYLASWAYYKAKGMPLAPQFEEVPPE